jgi:hypothetical protein
MLRQVPQASLAVPFLTFPVASLPVWVGYGERHNSNHLLEGARGSQPSTRVNP